jgi:hypothetical protein
MQHKTLFKAMAGAAILVALPVFALANSHNNPDRWMFGFGSSKVSKTDAPVVHGGTENIDEALAKIIPPPYKIVVDDSIPASTKIIWGDGYDWMLVLKNALSPIGLMADADWSNNVVTIRWNAAAKSMPAQFSEKISAGYGSLDAALDRLVPKHYHVVVDNGLSSNLVVAWPSGERWDDVLRRALVPLDMDLLIDNERATVMVSRPSRDKVKRIVYLENRKFGCDGADNFSMRGLPADSFIIDRNAYPDAKRMNEIKKLIEEGGFVQVRGYSGVWSEPMRIKWANDFAERMRKKIIDGGVDPFSVTVVKRTSYPVQTDKPGVEIVLMNRATNHAVHGGEG